jgi:hypothetical protein
MSRTLRLHEPVSYIIIIIIIIIIIKEYKKY